MKNNLFIMLTVAMLVMPAILQAAQPEREWKNNSGKITMAALDDPQYGDESGMVYLLKNGKRYTVPLRSLSQRDQNYVNRVRGGARDLDDDLWEDPVENNDRGMNVISAGNHYVLLIGVNEYARPYGSLQFCVNDMNLLANSFVKIGVPKEHIFLITDESPAERRPTGYNIRQQIQNVTKLVGPNDQLTIAFSGHGVMLRGKSYLCPSDSNLNDINSLVSRDWAFKQLDQCKAKQKVFIIDACRNNPMSDGQRAFDGARTIEDPLGAETHGFVLIASCDKLQKSWEDPDLKHGVFTYFLAEGLAGAASDNDGYVSILRLFLYASEKTKTFVYNSRNTLQIPTIQQGGETTNFILAKVEQPVQTQIEVATSTTTNGSYSTPISTQSTNTTAISNVSIPQTTQQTNNYVQPSNGYNGNTGAGYGNNGYYTNGGDRPILRAGLNIARGYAGGWIPSF
ncbi:MAG: caspase family protein [Thermoguttaceae bacterium]|nr:caspase family protein [Thermoguttaceae bacterium]